VNVQSVNNNNNNGKKDVTVWLWFVGLCEEYQLPYYDMVPADPTHDEMRRVVVIERRRPDIANRWQSNEVMVVNGIIRRSFLSH